jgi:5-methyltetrahydrofolate--homocysteine methyltransferase
MKKAVAHLVPFIEAEKSEGGLRRSNGKIVMATVKGDVHDIGKNIVGVVLRCNNYEVIDLGVMVPFQKILDKARDEQADAIGLSGLITPSLDEMVTVAKEMTKQGFDIPLLIGGATTSKAHTAVKIDPNYDNPVVHVNDASRSVGVMGELMNEESRNAFRQQTKAAYENVRVSRAAAAAGRRLLGIAEARSHREDFDWSDTVATPPSFLGPKVFDNFPIADLVDHIDWSPFFQAWEMNSRFPDILDDPKLSSEAGKLYDDAQRLLARIIDEHLLKANAVIGFFPAAADGDDVKLYATAERTGIMATLHFLRQQAGKSEARANFCLADFIAPLQSGVPDHIGAFITTAGIGLDELVARFEKDHDDYNSIMAKALSDRLAEAFAERMHELVRRRYWGYAPNEKLTAEELTREAYQGIRPAPGYPACPDHTEKATIWQLLEGDKSTGVRLTESFAMWPAASVCGYYFAHPQAHYFGLGRVGKDQIEEYARRKGMSVKEVERWLSPNLGYEA